MFQKIVPRTVEHVACVMAKRIAQKFVKRHCANPVQKTVLAAGIHQAVEDAHLGRTDAPLAHPALGRKRRQGKAFPCFPKGKQDASWRDSPWLTWSRSTPEADAPAGRAHWDIRRARSSFPSVRIRSRTMSARLTASGLASRSSCRPQSAPSTRRTTSWRRSKGIQHPPKGKDDLLTNLAVSSSAPPHQLQKTPVSGLLLAKIHMCL